MRALEPPEKLTVSQWCDKYRILNTKYSAKPGPYRTAETPYLREPLDAFTDPTIRSIHFAKCSRIGGTEWLNNIILYAADARPMPTIYVQPEKLGVVEEFTGRIRAMFEDGSPKVRQHVAGRKWCTRTHLRLDTMEIFGAWAENPRTMIRRTCGLAIYDEIDNCEKQAGSLGNTLKVLGERLVTFRHRAKLLTDGTPTFDYAAGWRALERSDFRKPYAPCPLCGGYQVFDFDSIRVPDKVRDPDLIVLDDLSWYECAHCHKKLDYKKHHRWMIDRTTWVQRTQKPIEPLPLDDEDIRDRRSLAVQPPGEEQWRPAMDGQPMRTMERGYWINVLYSPWRSWSQTIAEFFRVKDNPEDLRVFVNSWLTQPWKQAIEKTSIDVLREKRKLGHPIGEVSKRAKILLGGADVQIDRIYYLFRAYGPFDERWLVSYGVCNTLAELYEIAFYTGFPVGGNRDRLMRLHMLAVDCRYRQEDVYNFARQPGVVAVRGEATAEYKIKGYDTEYFPRGGVRPDSLRVYHVNTDYYKQKLSRIENVVLRGDEPTASASHWPREAGEDLLRHYTNEQQVWETVKSGKKRGQKRLVWQKVSEGARVDWWDCAVYCEALADGILNTPLLRESSAVHGIMRDKSPKPRTTPKAPGQWGGFIG